MVKIMRETNDIIKDTQASLERNSQVQARLLEFIESRGAL